MNVMVRRVLGYTLLPGIVPRAYDFLTGGFGFISWSMACVFEVARLLPRNHPYVSPQNIGKFTIRHVLAQAAANLTLKIRNIDQILLFALMLMGAVLLLAQLVSFGVAFFVQVAHATALPTTFAAFFERTPAEATEDISFIILDRIFGIPNLFGSCVAQNIPCFTTSDPNAVSDGPFPQPYHLALQEMFGFYSTGLLFVAAAVLVYYVISIAAEMSMSGTPFGRRFHRVWAPLRLIVALGLLIPMTNNINASQYITLYVAKYGSAFGTNFWNWFVQELGPGNTLLGDPATMIAKPQYPGPTEILQFFATVHTCKVAYKVMYDINIDAYLVRDPQAVPPNQTLAAALGGPKPYFDIQQWSDFGDITVVLGEYDPANPDKHVDFRGKVRPYCGVITLPTVRVANPAAGAFQDGADFVSYGYLLYLINQPWLGTASALLRFDEMAVNIAMRTLPKQFDPAAFGCPACTGTLPTSVEIQDTADWYGGAVKGIIDTGYTDMQTKTDWTNPAMIYGWAGAAIWYNKMVTANGDFTDAVFNLPIVTKFPEIQQWIQEARASENASVTGEARFEPTLVDRDIKFADDADKDILKAMNQTYALWGMDPNIKPELTNNNVVDAINAVFQKTSLFSFRQNEAIHPMAGLIALGRSMLTHSAMAFGGGTALGIIPLLGKKGAIGGVASSLSSFVLTIAYVGLTIGIVLYYVLPFLPFIYFFFAVATWAKTIFEAMVGMPLWALAHLRYDSDSEGFPTHQSMIGYFLLIDIFVRPALIVFGMLASGVIFYALVRTLNNVFDLVLSNLSGFDEATAKIAAAKTVGSIEFSRGPIDQMAFTIIYTIIVYMIGMSCFKLIDQVPNNILRWMNAGGANSFGRMVNDSAGERVSGAMITGSKLAGDQVSGLTGALTRGQVNVVSEG